MKSFTKRSLAILIAVLMVFSVMAIGITSSSAAAAGDKLYLVPNSNWTQSNARFAAYFFNNSTGKNTWIGMTAVEGESKLYEVTIPDGAWPNVIFCRMNPSTTANNWDSKWNQTKDLTVPTDDKNLYTVKSGTWDESDNNQWSVYTAGEEITTAPYVREVKLAGSFTNWADGAVDMVADEDGLYTYTTELAGGTHEFKIITDGDWRGNSGTINDTTQDENGEGNGWTMDTNNGDNCKLKASGGTYTFKYNFDTNKLIVIGENLQETESTEAPKKVYTVAGVETLCGTNWNAADTNNDMTDNGDGTYTKVYENVVAGEYEFKVVADHDWVESYGDGKENIKFTVVESATVTITFNEIDKTVSYTKEGDKEEEPTEPAPKTYTVAGVAGLCGGDGWDPTNADNDMTDEDGDGVFTKVYENVAAGTYQFKVVVNHDWAESYGDPNGPGGNVEFTVVKNATITITFDTNTNTLGYTKEGDEEEETTESTTPAPKEYVLMGYINGANVGTDTDWENVVEDYKFVDGTVTTTFDVDSYVAVKTTDNANWYWAQSFCEDTTVTLYPSGCDEKMFVPGGVEVEFTLVENEDGTITLSYVLNGEIPTSETTSSEDTEPVPPVVTLKGDFNEWAGTELTLGEDGIYTTTIELKGGAYEFKLMEDETWLGNGGVMEDTTAGAENGWEFVAGDDQPNCTLKATGGKYTFIYNAETNMLIVTAEINEQPSSESTPAEPEELTVTVRGQFNEWTDTELVQGEDGIYTATFELTAGTYEFKMLENGQWFGNNGEIIDTTTTSSAIGWEMKDYDDSNCKLTATGGTYTFNYNAETNMLIILWTPVEEPSEDTTPAPSETVKNGIVEENGGLYYYVDGVKTYAGLIKIDGYYYYVNSSCKVIAGKAYYISKTNLLLPSASYTFDETGKMVNPPAVEPDDEIEEDTVKNGLIREDGALVYYVDDVKTYGGLIKIGEDYYYVNSSCKAITGKAYYVSKTNNYMDRGSYTFDADGKMVR